MGLLCPPKVVSSIPWNGPEEPASDPLNWLSALPIGTGPTVIEALSALASATASSASSVSIPAVALLLMNGAPALEEQIGDLL